MAKYIDAEKLKSIIKVQIKERKEWMKDIDKSDRQDQLWSELNGEDMRILQTINSLQQEQPEESIPNNLGWISVKDRLPDTMDYVFTCIKMCGIPQCVGFHYYKDGIWWEGYEEHAVSAVEYWMPIPPIND